jgi:hypothetical protein
MSGFEKIFYDGGGCWSDFDGTKNRENLQVNRRKETGLAEWEATRVHPRNANGVKRPVERERWFGEFRSCSAI